MIISTFFFLSLLFFLECAFILEEKKVKHHLVHLPEIMFNECALYFFFFLSFEPCKSVFRNFKELVIGTYRLYYDHVLGLVC